MATIALTEISIDELAVYGVEYPKVNIISIDVGCLSEMENLIHLIFKFNGLKLNRETGKVTFKESFTIGALFLNRVPQQLIRFKAIPRFYE